MFRLLSSKYQREYRKTILHFKKTFAKTLVQSLLQMAPYFYQLSSGQWVPAREPPPPAAVALRPPSPAPAAASRPPLPPEPWCLRGWLGSARCRLRNQSWLTRRPLEIQYLRKEHLNYGMLRNHLALCSKCCVLLRHVGGILLALHQHLLCSAEL